MPFCWLNIVPQGGNSTRNSNSNVNSNSTSNNANNNNNNNTNNNNTNNNNNNNNAIHSPCSSTLGVLRIVLHCRGSSCPIMVHMLLRV